MNIFPRAPYGSMLKENLPERKKAKSDKKDDKYLKAIRALPCLVCGKPAEDAAHVRITDSTIGKDPTGKSQKPADKWAVPMCHADHMKQHSGSEVKFWNDLGIDPLAVCVDLNAAYPDEDAMEKVIRKIGGGVVER